MFCFIGNSDSNHYLSLQKFQFNNSDISQPYSYIKLGSTSKTNELKSMILIGYLVLKLQNII